MFFLPLYHNLQDAPCLVVGAGTTAVRKLRWLIRSGANITVVSPEADEAVKQWHQQGDLQWVSSLFNSSQVHGALRLVISATNDRQVNQQVFAAAQEHHVLVNCVDQPDLCTVVFPAIVDRFPIVVAISSMGNAPTLSRVVRGWIEARLPAQLPRLAELAAQLRQQVVQTLATVEQRKQFWERLFTGAVAEQALRGDVEAAGKAAQSMLTEEEAATGKGLVVLVGAGPGDPELITLKALRMLQAADVILYDKLANPALLDYARRDAQQVYVGKQGPKPGHPPRTTNTRSHQQSSINDLIIKYASAGHFVVRLKGGDPYIYGRGGEEVEQIVQAGFEVMVVPGITAAFGAAAVAGIPLTYRNVSQSVRFVTGHRVENVINLDWPEMTRADQTLVIYMGLVGLNQICQNLLAHGCEAERPVAVIENATYAHQRSVRATLSTIAEAVEAAELDGPSIVIVGDVVNLAPDVTRQQIPSAS